MIEHSKKREGDGELYQVNLLLGKLNKNQEDIHTFQPLVINWKTPKGWDQLYGPVSNTL